MDVMSEANRNETITSKTVTYTYPNREIQNVQVVKADSFDDLDFFMPEYDKDSFLKLYQLYRDFIIRKYAPFLGTIVLYRLPEDLEVPFNNRYVKYGEVYDPLALVTINFKNDITLKNGELAFRNSETKQFFETLSSRKALYIVKGKRKNLSFLPVSRKLGLLSSSKKDAALKVNSSFFVMDLFDVDSVFDHVGSPVGLKAKNGRIIDPPLYDREAFLVDKDHKVSIRKVSFNEITVVIDGIRYQDQKNAMFLSRPKYRKSPKGGFDIVVLDNEIVAVKKGGGSRVPSAGFILHLDQEMQIKDRKVSYEGMNDILFAIQVGNSVMVNGKKTDRFISPFYRFYLPFTISYPPSMYPLNYNKARAPRIVLGADKEGKMILLWLEGAGKFGYEPGKESCGASLKETAEICEKLGVYNGVHLDGGGSAQILIHDQRSLKLSDRDKDSYEEKERAVAGGLYIL